MRQGDLSEIAKAIENSERLLKDTLNMEEESVALAIDKIHSESTSILNQIKNKKYTSALNDFKGNILLVGINYDKETKKHSCVIEKSD